MALSLMLERTVLNNVDDVAGRWQYEGGTVFEEKRQIGYYASTKRVIFGADDPQLSPAAAAAAAARIGAPRPTVIPGRHLTMISSPQQVAAAIRAFVQSIRR